VRIEKHVLFGQDDWLFLYGGGHKPFDYLTGKRVPTPQSIANFKDNLERRASYCARHGIHFAHFVLPSKPLVMAEYLPNELQNAVKSLFESHYLPAFGGAGHPSLHYSRQALIAAKKHGDVFLKTDTHNNGFGMLQIAKHILDQLGYDPDIDDQILFKDGAAFGDLSIMLGRKTREKTRNFVPRSDTIRMFDNLPFLPSNSNNMMVLHNAFAKTEKRLMILGDSFIKHCLPILAGTFRDILYVRGPHFQPDVVQLFKPDHLLCSNTERYLASVDSDDVGDSMLLSLYGSNVYNPGAELIAAFRAELSYGNHPQRYRDWSAGIREHAVSLPDMGKCELRELALVDREDMTFSSFGSNPRMIFANPPIPNRGGAKITLRIISPGKTQMRLYYSGKDKADRHFSNARVMARTLEHGINHVEFELDDRQCGPRLRLDPISQPGEFTLQHLAIDQLFTQE